MTDIEKPENLLDALDLFFELGCLGLAPSTLEWYEKRLYPLVEFIGPEVNPKDVTVQQLLAWRRTIENKTTRYKPTTRKCTHPEIPGGYSVDTILSYLRAAKRFFHFLEVQEVIDIKFRDPLKLPKLPKRGRKGITEEDLGIILLDARTADREMAKRDLAVLMFLESTGCRRGGAAELRLSDVDLENNDPHKRRRATVREKGNIERTVFLTEMAIKAMRGWLKVRPPVKDDHFFLAHSPGQDWHAIKPDTISMMLKRYKTSLGISGKTSPHMWRHRFAKVHIQAGEDISQVAQTLGHSMVVCEAYYAQFNTDELQEAYDRVSPKVEENLESVLDLS